MANPAFIKTYDALTTLAAPVQSAASTSTTGGTLPAQTSYYVVSATNANGETIASNEISIVSTGTTSSNTINWALVPGATGYKIYRGTAAGAENVYYPVGNVSSYVDTGAANTAGTPLTTSTAVVTFNPYQIVRASPVDFQVQPAVGTLDPIIGVTTEIGLSATDLANNQSGRIDVIHGDIAFLKLDGTVAFGDPITSSANGYGIKAAPAAGINNVCVGRARRSGVAGDVIEVIISLFVLQG